MKTIRFTKLGLEQIKQEYQTLVDSRPPAVKELSRARELGDLSENGLYHAAKANLRSIDSRLRRLSTQIKLADVVSSQKFLVEQDGKKIEYEIVGDYEANPANHKISAYSPIGRALQGRKPDDTVKIETPNGTKVLKILKVL